MGCGGGFGPLKPFSFSTKCGGDSVTGFIQGEDIFAIEGDLYLITVNTIGVMGKGLAESFAKRFPDMKKQYKRDCDSGRLQVGRPLIYQGPDSKHYMMFPTKINWRDPSQYPWIQVALEWMIEAVGEEIDPKWRIIIPPLGCSNGGLSFSAVAPMIAEAASRMPNDVTVVYPWYYEFEGLEALQ